jgi:hypothetical protein
LLANRELAVAGADLVKDRGAPNEAKSCEEAADVCC